MNMQCPKIGKNKIFWRKIVIFHTKYPKNPGSAPVYILLKVLIIVDSKEEGKWSGEVRQRRCMTLDENKYNKDEE